MCGSNLQPWDKEWYAVLTEPANCPRRRLINTFDARNEKRLDVVIATFYFIMIIELNFARRQE